MLTGTARLYLFGFLISATLVTSCGPSSLTSQFDSAGIKQKALQDQTTSLIQRSPTVDSGDMSFFATGNLEGVPRTTVVLDKMLDTRSRLRATEFNVYPNSTSKYAPIFYDWAGKRIPVDQQDYRAFAGFYHVSEALKYATQTAFPSMGSLKLTVKSSSTGCLTGPTLTSGGLCPFEVWTDTGGRSFAETAYDPRNSTSTLDMTPVVKLGTPSSGDLSKKFYEVHESDIAAQEFGHLVEHAFARSLVLQAKGNNTALDAVLEGVADFFAAAKNRDPHIATYFEANADGLLPSDYRFGRAHIRNTENSLYFPAAYMNNRYLDGRVISGALNDFKKYLSGETVTMPNCTEGNALAIPCKFKMYTVTNRMLPGDAWDKTLRLAIATLNSLDTSNNTSASWDTFAKTMKTMCSTSSTVTSWCNLSEIIKNMNDSTASTVSRATILGYILQTRGLLARYDLVTDGQVTGDSPVSVVSGDLGFLEFPGDTGLSNSNGAIEPCEVVLIYPNISNNTFPVRPSPDTTPDQHVAKDLYDIRVKLVALGGYAAGSSTSNPAYAFQDVINPLNGGVVENVVDSTKRAQKYWGWLEPGKKAQDLIRASSGQWYLPNLGASFSQFFGPNNYPVPVGWIVRAPNYTSVTMTATFDVSYRVVNQSGTTFFSSTSITQKAVLPATGKGVCQ